MKFAYGVGMNFKKGWKAVVGLAGKKINLKTIMRKQINELRQIRKRLL